MTIPLPGMPDERLGVVGTRQLIAVQTFDIARLTAHPVLIIPGTFIAVTGMGPTDSNESGKTSFLSAVSLLLGDPEWRIAGTGATSVEALLFEPITAGAPIGVNAATEGYIVGVFADADDVAGTTYTVSMKISAGRPHVQVRHASGVHLARGATDRERHEKAPGIFRTLGGEPIGSTDYTQVLYGRSPRVLAYVASRGRVRSRPSLLKLDAGTFSPEQIGDALITLAGRATLFERDEKDRRDLAAKQEELAGHIERDREHIEREDEILRQVDTRNRLRQQAESAAGLWNKYRARAVLDSYAKAESAAILLVQANTEHEASKEELRRRENQREALQNQAALRQAVEDRASELSKHEQALKSAVGTEAVFKKELGELEEQLRNSRQAAAGHYLRRDGSAEDAVEKRDKLAKELDQVTRLRDDASGQAEGLRVDLELAQDGQVGLAGLIIRTLRDAPKPVSAVSLAEATTLAPATRPLWEARLAPWRDAVCIARADLPVALSALATMPGAILITPGASADSMAAAGSSAGTLPDGVLSSPPEAISLLHSLAEHMAVPTPVPYSTDARTGIHVVGGFEVPIVGGEDIRDHLGRRHGAVQVQLASLNQDVKTLGIQLEHAIITAGCAEAAERVATLAPEVANLAEKLAIHQNTVLPPLTTSRNDAWTAHGDAERALATREDTLNQLSDEILSLRGDLRGQAAAIERFTSASRPDDVVLAAWAKGKDAARAALGWPEKADPGIPDRIRDEAPAPAVDEASGAIERRRATALGDAARVHLSGALTALEYHGKGTGAPPSDLRSVAHRYVKFQDSDGEDLDGSLFETTLASFHSWLEDEADRDRAAPEQVAQARATRAETTEFVTSEVGKLDEALRETQQAITQRAAGALERISTELNRLNRESDGGLGARLDCDIIPPATPDQGWICRVTPRWRRNPSGPMLPYDNVTNTAQEKLFSIHLVLAALLAAPNPCGRVLILDELADSLGAEHRREVLDAITTVAKAHGITVLATCQDAILAEARPYCGEILYFNYPSKSEPLNRPTRVFGVDPDGARVELTAEAVIEGRNPM